MFVCRTDAAAWIVFAPSDVQRNVFETCFHCRAENQKRVLIGRAVASQRVSTRVSPPHGTAADGGLLVSADGTAAAAPSAGAPTVGPRGAIWTRSRVIWARVSAGRASI